MSRIQPLFTPFARRRETVVVGPELVAAGELASWVRDFKLGTAGYRDLLAPEDLFELGVPFNGLTVAVLLEARAQLAVEHGLRSLHVGGEVRHHTQELIDLAARIYAAHGIEVHLRPPEHRTTPIWLSSFGVFYEELGGGENFTASHSASFKGGWKPMDASGGQLLELADAIADRVRELVARARDHGLTIELAAADDPLIRRDFDSLPAYVAALYHVIPRELLDGVTRASEAGFRAAFCTEGGSMGATGRRVFAALGIGVGDEGPVILTLAEESPDYHGIGIVDGVNHGVDPGKWQVYKNVGAQEILRERTAHVFFIWDPDGDRFNMVTQAPASLATAAAEAGLEVEPLDDDRSLVYFKPNQLYFLLTALRIDTLRAAGDLDAFDWIVATTYPTSRSIGELAESSSERYQAALRTVQTPVGFKHFAALVRELEAQLAAGTDPKRTTTATGERIELGTAPRLLILAEESGGAAMGPIAPLRSRTGQRISLAAKEKDACQVGILALCLAARLHLNGESFASFYLDQLEKHRIRYRFYERRDVTLYDESLAGEERRRSREAGIARREAVVEFFASLEDRPVKEATAELKRRLPPGAELPPLRRVFHAGDGTYVEMVDQWFELRASGTDAVLRYYMEGAVRARVSELNRAFTELEIPTGSGGRR
jgi:phosphomannomutase